MDTCLELQTLKLKHRSQKPASPHRLGRSRASRCNGTSRRAGAKSIETARPAEVCKVCGPFPEEPRLAPARKEGALKSLNLLSDTEVGELCAGPLQDTAEPAARQRRLSSLAQKGICKDVFQCELCPFRKKLNEVSKLLDVRKRHLRNHHGGQGLAARTPRLDHFVKCSRDVKVRWKCPLCNMGIKQQTAAHLSPHAMADLRRFHRENHHPRVTPKEWMLLLQKQCRESMIAKRRVTSLNAGAASIVRTQLPAHLTILQGPC